MACNTRPRFRSPQAALRFYFRASELLTDNARPGVFSKKRPAQNGQRPNAIYDFLSVDACFVPLNEAQVWILRELYRPNCFGTPHRRVATLFDAARRKFPKCRWTHHMIARVKRNALRLVQEGLKREHLM